MIVRGDEAARARMPHPKAEIDALCCPLVFDDRAEQS
jgi:hypothetical protein